MSNDELQDMLNNLDQLYERYAITEDDRDVIWNAIAEFCAFQLRIKQGPFYQRISEEVN
jgi:hypothetical protein